MNGDASIKGTTVGSFSMKLGTNLPPGIAFNTGGSQEPRRKSEGAIPSRQTRKRYATECCREDKDAITKAATVDSFSTGLTSRERLPQAGRVILHAITVATAKMH